MQNLPDNRSLTCGFMFVIYLKVFLSLSLSLRRQAALDQAALDFEGILERRSSCDPGFGPTSKVCLTTKIGEPSTDDRDR